jgi:hypothetical protein
MSRNDQPPQGGSPDQVYQRLAWLAERRPADPFVIHEAIAARRAAEAAALAKKRRTAEDPPVGDDSLWVPVGPAAVLRGQPETEPRVSGRVRALAVHPDGQRVYAGTANGGVWYSDDAGVSWLPVAMFATKHDAETKAATGAAGAEGLTVGALAVRFGDAADGSGDDVLVGTGEPVYIQGVFGGVGVLHATGPVPVVRAHKLANPWTREASNLVGYGCFRLARNPDRPEQVVAATNGGLFLRTLPAAADSAWECVSRAPFSDDDTGDSVRVTDVAWVKPPGAAGTRLWIALHDRRDRRGVGKSGLWVADVDAEGHIGAFKGVALRDLGREARIGLAAAALPSRLLYALSVTGQPRTRNRKPVVWRIDDASSPPTVKRVDRVPPHLFGKPEVDQHEYDLTIAVDPTDANRVVLGGAALDTGNWAAALFVCAVRAGGPTGFQLSFTPRPAGKEFTDPFFRGWGVHADVHAAVFARSSQPSGERDLWIGCDGGVFVSHRNGHANTFVARNTGIASLEVGFIASNPVSDVDMLAGTQDNGTIQRIGVGVWKAAFVGDGGGLAYDPDPRRPDRFVRQHINTVWNDQDRNLLGFVARSGDPSEQAEDEAASFYSDADAVVSGERTLLAIGSTRVWVSHDWGADGSWVTLPSCRDPRVNPHDSTTDLCVPGDAGPGGGSSVITLRWSPWPRHTDGPLRLLVLCRKAVIVHDVVFDPAHRRLRSRDVDRVERQLPAATWTDAFWHDRSRGAHGSFYVTTAGPSDPAVQNPPDTLWWFDGKDTWFPTGLRSSPGGTKAPAYAVVVDPDDNSIVYVGTGAGVWRGRLDADSRTWSWVVFSNGLPEATVADLEIVKVGAVKLLRAGVQALGVFEVDLKGPTPPRTFLRVHELDSRRVAPATLTDPRVFPAAKLRWEASPDIRPRMHPGAPMPAPPANAEQDLTDAVESAFDRHRLWAFQTALHRLDPMVKADGRWSLDFETRLLARRKAAGVPNPESPRVDRPIWRDVVTRARCYATPWDDPAPTEADLLELVIDRPPPTGDKASLALTRGRAVVEVLVHHRHQVAVDAAEVRVVLLRHALAASPDNGAALPVAFTAKLAQALASGGPPSGGWGSLPGGWTVADAARPLRSPGRPVHPRTPRAVNFDVDFGASPANSRWILVAVAASTLDPAAFTGATLRDLVLRTRCVAARTVHLV